ncbi:MAG: AAA family ATPase [Bacilli bacterium]
MGQICGKIVLTGGPCAGKTSALSRIEKKLIEQGYHVFVLAESATEFIKGGIRAFGKCALENECFESLILNISTCQRKVI